VTENTEKKLKARQREQGHREGTGAHKKQGAEGEEKTGHPGQSGGESKEKRK